MADAAGDNNKEENENDNDVIEEEETTTTTKTSQWRKTRSTKVRQGDKRGWFMKLLRFQKLIMHICHTGIIAGGLWHSAITCCILW